MIRTNNRHRLIELWNTFGLYINPSESEWAELKPVLDRLPPLDLRDPVCVDQPLAEAALARHFSAHGKKPRPITWFADAFSARAYACTISMRARHAFPATDAPAALAVAWHSGDQFMQSNPQRWAVEQLRVRNASKQRALHAGPSEEIVSRAALLELFAAGCFYYCIEPEQVLCVARPSLWMEHWKLHRKDGPAVSWPTGEQYFFWRGTRVSRWVIEDPDRLTPRSIRREPNVARRFGRDRYAACIPQRERILERWNDWNDCCSIADFQALVRSDTEQIFAAVSRRLLSYAAEHMDRFIAEDFQRPRVDGPAIEEALRRFFFANGRSRCGRCAGSTTAVPPAPMWLNMGQCSRARRTGQGSRSAGNSTLPGIRAASPTRSTQMCCGSTRRKTGMTGALACRARATVTITRSLQDVLDGTSSGALLATRGVSASG